MRSSVYKQTTSLKRRLRAKYQEPVLVWISHFSTNCVPLINTDFLSLPTLTSCALYDYCVSPAHFALPSAIRRLLVRRLHSVSLNPLFSTARTLHCLFRPVAPFASSVELPRRMG